MMKKVLGIETSCDETAVAIVDSDKNILSHKILSQVDEHKIYGGVVPEIAARSHIEYLPNLIKECLSESKIPLEQIDGIAATGGPGLIGGVIAGVVTAKAMASTTGKPFIAVNHLEGHALTAHLTNDVKFPYLLLLISGGHCEILIAKDLGKYEKLGGTIDDAVGESFDKVAKMLGLGYPGGVEIEKLALEGNPNAFDFPKPLCSQKSCDFSFSGLKTSVRRTIEKVTEAQKNDICASFQRTVSEILADRLENAVQIFKQRYPENNQIVVAGGVAANKCIRFYIEKLLSQYSLEMVVPPIKLCTDNAAMIAWAGLERLRKGYTTPLDFEPRSRWPLEEI